MPTETITITVTGANPQTKTVAVNVDPTTGTGSTSVTFTGVNGGQDQFSAAATIASHPYVSNNAFVAWQAANGTVSLASNLIVAGYVNPGENPTWHGVGAAYGTLTTKNTVVINQVFTNGTAGTGVPIVGLTTDDGNTGQYKHTPPLLDDVKSDGTALTSLGTPLSWGQGAAGDGAFVTFFQGQLVVAQAGVQTFYFLVDDSWALYVGGGASYVAGAFTTTPGGGAPASPSTAIAAISGTSLTGVGAWPLLGTRNTPAIGTQPTDYVYINFPTPGIYPFLAWFVNNGDSQTFFQMTYAAGTGAIPPAVGNGESGGVIKPVALQAAPPATTPAGNLQLSLAQSNIQIQGNQITVNVSVNGIVYANKQYIPIFEGTPGKLFIYNDPSHVFNFQSYNGSPVDKASAATNVFTLNGNTQSLLSVAYNDASDGQFSLKYSGTPFPPGIAASTQLTVTAEDIAWFNTVNKSYDTFVPASVGAAGGISFGVEVDYLTNPTSVAVSPSSVPADGDIHVFTVTLSEPMSPQQIGTGGKTTNTVTASFTSNSGTSVQTGSVAAQFNTSGFLTGYTVPVSVPFSTSNGSFNLFTTLTGTLSYLTGTSFVINGPVTYMSNVNRAISLTGTGFQPPVPYQFSVSPNDTALSNQTYTLTGVAYTRDNNPMTMNFYYNSSQSGAQLIGAGTQQGGRTAGTVNGQTVYLSTFTVSFIPPSQTLGTTDLLGFIATDTVSGLSTQYYSNTTYSFPVTITYGVTIVQSKTFSIYPGQYSCIGGNTPLFSMPQPVTAGNILVMGVNEFDWSNVSDNANYSFGFHDSLGNTFGTLTPVSYNSYEEGTWIACENISNGGPCTIYTSEGFGCHHASANNAAISIVCVEVQGMTFGVAKDAANGFNLAHQQASQPQSSNTGTVNTSNQHDVIWTCAVANDPPSGYTNVGFAQGCNGFCWSCCLAYLVVDGAGSYSPIWQSPQSSGVTLALKLAAQE
jgi:hypothetical protein